MPSARAAVAWLLPAAAAVAAFSGSLAGDWVFDDGTAIAGNTALQAGDWWQAAFGDRHTSLAGRPFTCLSFTLTFALGLESPANQRLLNLLLHVLAALLLLAVVRRALRGPVLAERFATPRATWIAAAVAVSFAAHPLAADVVAYPTQRSMLLMALAFLTAAYATLRSHGSARRRRWLALACAAVAFGMGCKEEFAAAPILIGLLPFAFLEPTFAGWRRHRWFHLGLAAGWLVLIACVALAPDNRTVGFSTAIPVSPVESLATQAPVVVHYAVSSLWPNHLTPVYDWPVVRSPSDSLLPGAAIVAALVATGWLWRRHRWWAWLGTMFFLLLAPTSSVLPILTELVAERRTYLPKLALLIPVVIGASTLLARIVDVRRRALAGGVLLAVAASLAIGRAREAVRPYLDNDRLWQHAFEHNRLESRSLVASTILGNRARTLRQQGRNDEAHELLDHAAACEGMGIGSRTMYGISLLERGRLDEGIAQLRMVLQWAPGEALATRQLCLALIGSYPRRTPGPPLDVARGLAEAEQLLTALLREQPGDAEAHNLLGLVLGRTGRHDRAEVEFRAAVGLAPDFREANVNLATALRIAGRVDDAVAALRRFAARRPDDADVLVQLAQLLAEIGDFDGARQSLQQALRVAPGHAGATALQGRLRRGG